MSTEAAPSVVTASATADGRPLYLRDDGTWTPRLVSARVTSDIQERDRLLNLARADQATVCDPYVIEVARGPVGPEPKTLRERIRSEGPTIPIPRAIHI